MLNDPTVDAAANAYTDLPANFGPDTHLIRISETDAFRAGVAWLVTHPAEYARLAAEWGTNG